MIPWRQSEAQQTTRKGGLCSVRGQLMAVLSPIWHAWKQHHHREKQLRVRETLSFGERRFVAVVEFEQRRFLIGGTGASISMLADLTARGGEPAAGREPGARGAA